MRSESLYPRYIRRHEELRIKQWLDQVKNDGRSRALLLYGSGGVGKTSLVRRMSQVSTERGIRWLDPIDVDDSEYWLLSKLESRIAGELDPDDAYFGPYRQQLSQLPNYLRENISRETVVSYLGRMKETFADCYNHCLADKKMTVVMVFDTVETIRETRLLSTLLQWMKTLPKGTLFVLSGRPLPGELEGGQGSIEVELDNPHQSIPVTTVEVSRFTFAAARNYVEDSQVSDELIGQEKEKLTLLTRGQPLWLAFVLDYLREKGIPEEAENNTLDFIARNIPYEGEMTPEGSRLHQEFLRRLVAPYQESDFWHEAVKRLAVVRQPVGLPVWEELMADLALPDDIADLRAAWEQLLTKPWIRQRGNGNYVTLHDAVAEAFAQRLFPLHDQDEQWRRRIWERAHAIYRQLAAEAEENLRPELAALNRQLGKLAGASAGASTHTSPQATAIISRSVQVDTLKRDLDQLKVAGLYYLFLTNFEQGCRELLQYFEQADKEHDPFIQDLLALYLQRFLPGGAPAGAFDDVIKAKLDEFRIWLYTKKPDYYAEIGATVARYLIDIAQPETALELLNQLPEYNGQPDRLHRLHILRGNACMRIPERVSDGEAHFKQALDAAMLVSSPDRNKLLAEAHKEHGYYYRNIGQWQDADRSYELARDAIVEVLSTHGTDVYLEEMASIQTNWAYVKGLGGNYNEGVELAENAVAVRRRLGGTVEAGISLSVSGEVYRYAKRFEKAWTAYSAAERVFQERRQWGWLGLIHQEQAICLHQALLDSVELVTDPRSEAKRLITSAMDICLTHSIRSYPSALNRAGRIFGDEDADKGLGYLDRGIREAYALSDGWFLFANLVEYAELSYRAWVQDGESRYRTNIDTRAQEIGIVAGRYSFPDLAGRWYLLRGHVAIRDYLRNHDTSILDQALTHYKAGFANIARRPFASSGAAAIPAEFKTFEQLFRQLPPGVRSDWQTEFTTAWRGLQDGSTVLLARLHELY
jgi:hypothetical protein